MPKNPDIKKVLVLGSGPIVIGQAAEFDYAGTQACRALKEEGMEVVLINSNPATIMTDKDIADHVYIEPMNIPSVTQIIEKERPDALLPNMGGQTGLNLAMALYEDGTLAKYGVKLLGTSPESIHKAEDRQGFKDCMEAIGQPCVTSKVVNTVQDAVDFTNEIGYPVIVRPAYTLGGSGGGIAYDEASLREISDRGIALSRVSEVLIERCISGWKEIEFEVMRDSAGNVITICSMENIDPVGVHTGDSIAVYPPLHLEEKHRQLILQHTKNMAMHLGVIGLINAQYILYDDDIYVIEVNPRSSRTIPYISKVTGVPIIDLATKVMLGQKLKDLNFGTGLYPEASYYAVKAPVFSFEKLTDVDTGLGPEMKSTGEVLGLAETYPQALLKAFKGSGMRAPKRGGRIIITVKDEDKQEILSIARGFEEMGVELYGTSGTCQALNDAGIECKRVNRVSQSHPNILDMIASGTVDLIINTPTRGRKHDSDGFQIRRSAVEHGVGCVTAVDTARALLTVRQQSRSEDLSPIDITKI